MKSIAVRLLVAYPICFCLYGSAGVALVCVKQFTNDCFWMIFLSPILLIAGPLAHDEGEPANIYLQVLIAAIVVTAIWTLFAPAGLRQKPAV